MASLATSIESAPRIHKRIVPALKRLGIRTLWDLLFHFPTRYEDFSNVKKISEIAVGETVTVEGKITRVTAGRTMRKRMTLTHATVQDETGSITATWFNQPFLSRNLKVGDMIRLSGKIARGPKEIYLQNPAYEKPTTYKLQPTSLQGIHTGGLVPVYPETAGITSRWMRFLIKSFLGLARNLSEPLPESTLKKYNLPHIQNAIPAIHFPRTRAEAAASERRFIFEAMLLIQLRALRERARINAARAPEITCDVALLKEFVKSLPFPLTDAQRRSIWEIAKDMEKPRPMNRLLEGDVGSGKTVVAAAASLLAAKTGYRVAFMAPTEILARQHYATLAKILAPFHISIGLLVGSEKHIAHHPDIIIGTHALIQRNILLENLGLVVIDEQHRFGVAQRAMLQKQESRIKNQGGVKSLTLDSLFLIPHFLSMTATPIPRTLALTIYGDLDLSLLDEMPKSRKPILTRIVSPKERRAAYEFIREEVKKGRQAFVICPRIEPLDQESRGYQQRLLLAEVKTVKEEYKKLSEAIFQDLSIAMLHGKMKPKEKDAVMKKFRARAIDILVSTSVIEVGVDIPNATIMMIEGAEIFGLATLHQFRGRVGRGSDQSYCLLFPTEDGLASRRLRAVVEAKNGFALAEEDLKIRGPGELFGTRQSGASDLVFKGITNPELVRAVRQEAMTLVKTSPDLARYEPLRARLEQFERSLHLE